MKNETRTTEASRHYAMAYQAHYTDKKLLVALELYQNVMTEHPNTQEANYSRGQIKNIINSVVPEQELFDAQLALTRSYLEHKEPVGAESFA